MQALVFEIRLNSLYSIRLPFTWQSSLIYPVLPPSSVIGLAANALQRYKNNKHPLEYLKELQERIEWAGSRLLFPCVIKSYTTSAITKWKIPLGGKSTNALGREFAYSRGMQLLIIYKDEELIKETALALKTSPITAGDSESPVFINDGPYIKKVKKYNVNKEETVVTNFPFPFEPQKLEIIEGRGLVFLFHEKCLKIKNFPLRTYVCPLAMGSKNIICPETVKLKFKQEATIFEVEEAGKIVFFPASTEESSCPSIKKKGGGKKKR